MAEEKEKKKSKAVMYVVIAVIAIVVIIAIAGSSNQSNSNQPQNNQTVGTTTQPSIDPTQLVALKSQCATDGAKYIDNFEKNFSAHALWGTPSYHFNQKLNTCLATVNWLQTISETNNGEWTSPDNFTINEDDIFYGYVFDVYSNQVLLQREAEIVTVTKSKVSTTLSDTLVNPPLYPVPNLDANSFKQQYQTLFSE
ncbi:MAG: hypothetical protein ABSA74_02225 [Candidatus Staskawiczbacteria bacterium]|jgi:hypothetical protein